MIKWKVFFWVLVIAVIGAGVFHVSQGKSNSELFISLAACAFLLIPYFGYAYQKKIAVNLLWKTVFVVQVILTIIVTLAFVIGQYLAIKNGGELFYDSLKIIAIIPIALLSLIPPYLYAFNSHFLWQKR